MQSKRYYEHAVIVRIVGNPNIPLSEGSLVAKLTDRSKNKETTLDCFVFDWKIALTEGENALLKLHLVGLSKKSHEMKKSFSYRKISVYTNQYTIRGEIVEVYSDSKYPELQFDAVIDCGFYFTTTISRSLGLKIGDYIQVTGRLDAHIVGKVNDEK